MNDPLLKSCIGILAFFATIIVCIVALIAFAPFALVIGGFALVVMALI